ncbi:MAG TPA: type III polyketide synthase [Terriglobia bacterium]|nr:type III polyketide synthase [Terriglobia bacterium]
MATATAPRPRVERTARRREQRSHNPGILGIGTANPAPRFTQEEAYRLAGYDSQRILEIFLNSDIDTRHFYVDLENINRHETPDELNQRYLRGAMEIGTQAVATCLDAAGVSVRDVDLLVTCTCTGYVCPDVGTRLIAEMGFRRDVERAPMMGLGCAGALPTLQRASDYARAHPGRKALMLAVEICSAAYFIDNTLETVVGNAICADGAAAFLLSAPASSKLDSGAEIRGTLARLPQIVDFESFIDPGQLDKVGFEQRDGKLRIILAALIRDLAAPMIARSLDPLLERNGLARSDIRFWVAHPGGRKVIDNVQREMGLTDEQLRHSKKVMRNYGNMSSPTVMFVLDEVVRHGEPRPGDWGVMIALGPGMAAETALLRW